MLKIGDFSQLAQVSVRALRIYDEMGLLKPVHVDRFSGYRYYEAEQLPRLNRIIALTQRRETAPHARGGASATD